MNGFESMTDAQPYIRPEFRNGEDCDYDALTCSGGSSGSCGACSGGSCGCGCSSCGGCGTGGGECAAVEWPQS